jgi:acyl-CoA thioesterase
MSEHHGFHSHLGLKFGDAGDGRARLLLDIGPKHLSPTKTVHGGVIYALADTTMGAALWTVLTEGETIATISANVDYLAAVTDGTLSCEAEVVRRGKRTAFTRALIRNERDELVAQVTAAFHVGPGSGKRLGKGETSADETARRRAERATTEGAQAGDERA